MKKFLIWSFCLPITSLIFLISQETLWLVLVFQTVLFVLVVSLLTSVEDEAVEELDFTVTVQLAVLGEESVLWTYNDNVIPRVGNTICMKRGRTVESYMIDTVCQSYDKSVTVYVSHIHSVC